MPITAAQAEAILPGRRKKWQVAPVPAIVQKMSEEGKVYIHNVGPRTWARHSSTGTFLIPGCVEGEKYATARPIPGVVHETVPVDQDKLERISFDGMEVAKDIVGTGSFRDSQGPYSDNLTRFGVFISRNEHPTEDELAAATQAWHNECARIVQDGDRLYEVNGGVDAKSGISNISDSHIAALKTLNWARPWARRDVAQALINCPACGETINPTSAMCKHCDAVLDEEKARKYFPHKFEKRGPGRPPKDVA